MSKNLASRYLNLPLYIYSTWVPEISEAINPIHFLYISTGCEPRDLLPQMDQLITVPLATPSTIILIRPLPYYHARITQCLHASLWICFSSPPFRQLTDENYPSWLVDIRALLRKQKIWKYTQETPPPRDMNRCSPGQMEKNPPKKRQTP